MSERDREPDLHWSMAADYSREDLDRKFRALGAYEDDPREPVVRRRSQIIDVDAQQQSGERMPVCTARKREASVDHNSREYRRGLQHVADQLGLDVEDLLAADREIYRR